MSSKQCSQCKGWSRIFPHRFENDGARPTHQPQLLSNDKAILLVAHHQGRGQSHVGDALHPAHSGLQQRIVTHQWQELLWVFFT